MKGVPDFVIRTEYYGETHLLVRMPREQQNAVNRRVEVRLIPPG